MQNKRILICRYQSICEPDIIEAFQKNDYEVIQFNEKIKSLDYDVAYVKNLSKVILEDAFEFVFSVNFIPIISKLCNVLKIPYVCWLVDSPVVTMYSDGVKGEYNRIFIFDRALYEQYYPKNPDNMFHLPLAANVNHWDAVCEQITNAERVKYAGDISFVGSLYTEKCPYNQIKSMSPHLRSYLEELMDEQKKVYGRNFLAERLTEDIIAEFGEAVSWEFLPDDYEIQSAEFIADEYLGIKISEQERIQILNMLAEKFSVHFYTQSDSLGLHNVIYRGSAESRYQMPKIFRCSKINLNPTAKSIKTGISQRVWDILGCGGFLISNYQTELPEHFELGRDLETYSSMEELADKCAYYLTHEEERKKIARNGYEKVKKYHTYENRIRELLDILKGN